MPHRALISLLCSSIACICFLIGLPSATRTGGNAFLPQGSVSAQFGFRIKQRNPVVNEGNQITLNAVDASGRPVSGVIWQTGSPDIAAVDATSGRVLGIKQGFATITARKDGESFSVFLVVTRVKKANGARVPGDTKLDAGGRVYISNPAQNVILRAANALSAPTEVFAGRPREAGRRNGDRSEALFAGPTAITVDNSVAGGLYIADTLNHSIRKIGFDNRVESVLGTGMPGISLFDGNRISDIANVQLNSPRGIAADNTGNIFIADTDNHAIYFLDMAQRKLLLLAGQPGESGKEDGAGRSAKFKRPAGMALSNDGRLLTVADEDNNRVRLIELKRDERGDLTGLVSTLGVASGSKLASRATVVDEPVSDEGELVFDRPQSVSQDAVGNIYVVDRSGVQVVTRPFGSTLQVVQLAQPDVSFNQAVSVVVNGTQSFVLDANANNDAESLKIVSVGGPEIESVTPEVISGAGGTEVVIKGRNFAPESVITFGDGIIEGAEIVSATEIRFRLEPQSLPGVRTVTVLTRGGLAQREVNIISKPRDQLMTGEITTIAGGKRAVGDGGKAIAASLGLPNKLLLDSAGNILFSDINQGIRLISADTGIINTVAGGGLSLEDGVLANTAQINPATIALDRDGNIFFAEFGGVRVRRIDALTRVITTVAGATGRGFVGDGGPARDAGFESAIKDLAFDRNGNLFVLSETRIRRIDGATGIITTVAGNGVRTNIIDPNRDNNVAANQVSLVFPNGLSIDAEGNMVFIEASGFRLRRIDARTGLISTIIGSGTAGAIPAPFNFFALGSTFDGEGRMFISGQGLYRFDPRTRELIQIRLKGDTNDQTLHYGIAVDGTGNLFVSAFFGIFRVNAATGESVRVAGVDRFNFRGDNGPAVVASLGDATSVASDKFGNIYLADLLNKVVRKIDTRTGIITTVVGGNRTPGTTALGDGGPANDASCDPFEITVNSKGDLLIIDVANRRIRKVDANTGIITTIAGNGKARQGKDGKLATKTSIGFPRVIRVDKNDNIFLGGDGRILRIDARSGILNVLVEKRTGVVATPFGPSSMAIDKNGIIYFTEQSNLLRSFDPTTREVKTLFGNSRENIGILGEIAFSPSGDLFIAATNLGPLQIFSERIFRLNLKANTLGLVVGSTMGGYSGDGGPAINASLAGLSSLSFDNQGNLLILSTNNSIVALRLIKLTDR